MLFLGTPVDLREKSPVSSYSTYYSSFSEGKGTKHKKTGLRIGMLCLTI